MRKSSFLVIILIFITSFSLTACGKPSAASLGIEKPLSGGNIPIGNIGLSVYGTGKIDPASKTAKIEIETSELPKVKEGYGVNLRLNNMLSFTGQVKSVPHADTNSDSSTCTIEAVLDADQNPDISGDSEFDATIRLPAKEGTWVVDNKCIEDGNNDKKYAWVSTKKDKELDVNDDSWELTEIKTGETDGKRTEITEGLKGYKTIFMRVW